MPSGLSLLEAVSEFYKRCGRYPSSTNIMLGVEYTTSHRDLEPAGKGAADLLQRVSGHLHISKDYEQSAVLSQEGLIANNAVSFLKQQSERFYEISDKYTAECASTIKPLLPIAVPFESKFSGSLGKALSAVDFDRDVILKNIFMATDKIGILSYNIRGNSNSYAVVSPDRMDDLFIQLRQQMGAQIIVDYTSDIVNSKLTAKAVINATHVVELLTCDTNGLVFDDSQEPILQSEQYKVTSKNLV